MTVRTSADSYVASTGVVRRAGAAWFAAATGHTVTVYRWRDTGWVGDGTVDLPEGMATPATGGNLSSTYVTSSGAPDFAVHAYGADTLWFALVARLNGRWQLIPFDDQFRHRDLYTFASGAEGKLIHGIFDACGCAGGPTTDQWYRFADGVFVSTQPPGGAAVCSARALQSAAHWPPLPYDPLVRKIGRPFNIVRFACADGWAIATDGHDVGVYEQHGRRLDHPVGRRWLRVGVGTPRQVGVRTEFALPRSLLDRLAARIGIRLPAASLQPSAGPPAPVRGWQRAALTFGIRPGEQMSVEPGISGRRPKQLGVRISSGESARLIRFRWRDGRWVRAGD